MNRSSAAATENITAVNSFARNAGRLPNRVHRMIWSVFRECSSADTGGMHTAVRKETMTERIVKVARMDL